MKNRLSLLSLGFLGILALTPSCGADEGTSEGDGGSEGARCTDDRQCREPRYCSNTEDPNSSMDGFCHEGDVCHCVSVDDNGGSTGTGGATGSGGSKGGSAGSVIGGKGGTGGTPTANALGEPCAADADCGGAGLFCLLPDGLPSGNGPPNGLCTVSCANDDPCLELASGAYCVGFEEDAAMMTLSYCILACTGGAIGAPKCRLRDDFACGILDTIPTAQTCTTTNDCPVNHVCFAEVEGGAEHCQEMVTACRPTCRADADCTAGQFCDFVSGFCTAAEPPGLPIGAVCNPNLPAAQDECNGFCLATDDTMTEGTCTAFCSAGLDAFGCGWVGEGTPDAGCLFATVVSRDAGGQISLAESDLMLCGGLCDCNDDCPAAADFCMDENAANAQASINAIFGRAGYCRPLIAADGETEADSIMTCP